MCATNLTLFPMSSQLIGEIELSLRESLESQITPNENLDDEITIDFSPFVDDREAEDYDRSSEEESSFQLNEKRDYKTGE